LIFTIEEKGGHYFIVNHVDQKVLLCMKAHGTQWNNQNRQAGE
jgi:hypothetical protein